MPDVSFDVIAVLFLWKPTERKTERKKNTLIRSAGDVYHFRILLLIFFVVVGVFSFFYGVLLGYLDVNALQHVYPSKP